MFPDTYRFPVGADNEAVAQRMVENFDQRFAQTFETQITQSGRSVADLANVGAMVEKEAETDGDRAPIAGVIYNRLKKNMRLQIDATVQYAQGFHKTRLMYSDLTVNSAYNTYKNAGLPPGPICNPGLPSLRAALEPAHSDYLFYRRHARWVAYFWAHLCRTQSKYRPRSQNAQVSGGKDSL